MIRHLGSIFVLVIASSLFSITSLVADQLELPTLPLSPILQFIPACNTEEAIEKFLTSKFSETVVGFGMESHGKNLVQLYVSESGGWSFVLVRTYDRWSCIMATGEHWQTVSPMLGKPAVFTDR